MDEHPKPRKLKLKQKIRFAAVALLVVIVLLFMFLNLEAVEVNVIFAKITIRRSFMIIGVLAIGFASGWLAKANVPERRSVEKA